MSKLAELKQARGYRPPEKVWSKAAINISARNKSRSRSGPANSWRIILL